MKRLKYSLPTLVICCLQGCGTMSFVAVEPGPIQVGDLRVASSEMWNRAPSMLATEARRNAQVWTRDGLLLDRIYLIPGVPDGETLFVIRDDSVALPRFRADMLPNELEEFTESSLVTLFGEGNAVVDTSGLRPHLFGQNQGVIFDFEASLTDAPDRRGLVGAFIADGVLYMMVYIAADPYYYEKHLAEAQSIIETASL